jgi:phage tail-like protein
MTMRDLPFPGYNFLVDLGTGTVDGADAGFQECSPIATERSFSAYRNGNDKEDTPRLIAGLEHPAPVTLRRGIIGSDTLHGWFKAASGGPVEARTVTITLLSEDRATTVATWVLRRARPSRCSSGPFDGLGATLPLEELTLVYESLDYVV